MNVSNFDEEIVTNAKEKGKELLSHLSLEERREKLDTMVSLELHNFVLILLCH